jgi:hypothetical protein
MRPETNAGSPRIGGLSVPECDSAHHRLDNTAQREGWQNLSLTAWRY